MKKQIIALTVIAWSCTLLPGCTSVSDLRPTQSSSLSAVSCTPSQGLGDSLGSDLHASITLNDVFKKLNSQKTTAFVPSIDMPATVLTSDN